MIGKLENIVWQVSEEQCSLIGATSIRSIVESCLGCYHTCCAFTMYQGFSRMDEA
jgi:hypothetical protein